MNDPIIELNDVSYRYADGTAALEKMTFAIHKGKKIAVLGNNGAGKSTFFLLLNAILKATSGTIKYKGERISYKRNEIKRLRQSVGIVFQDSDSQLFASSVYEDIKFGPRNLGLSPEKVEEAVTEAMALTETEVIKNKPPHLLSVGQKKRVAIATVIGMSPELFILDEPTAGLDPYYASKIMKVLSSIHNQDRTIMLSTHDVNLAYEWADEVIILHNGRIIAQGKPADVFQNNEAIARSHLEKPWILEVFEQLNQKNMASNNYPKTKNDLFRLISQIAGNVF